MNTTEHNYDHREQQATDSIDLVLHFEDVFTAVIENTDVSCTSCLVEALAEAAAEFVQDFDAVMSEPVADQSARIAELEADKQRLEVALTKLTNPWKFSTEVTSTARDALAPPHLRGPVTQAYADTNGLPPQAA